MLTAALGCRSIPDAVRIGGETSMRPLRRMKLFNGVDLNGWTTWLVDSRGADPRKVFGVTNGWLRISGDGLGYVGTRESYRDYRLVLEYRWGSNNTRWGDRLGRARDSGVFLHAQGPDGNSHDGRGAFRAAIECNVFEGATGDFLLIRGDDAEGRLIAPWVEAEVLERRDAEGWPWWQAGGRVERLERMGRVNWKDRSADWRDVTGFRGTDDRELPAPAWNRLEIVSVRGRIEIWLNGGKVNEVIRSWPDSGPILLQCEGSEIFFRRVELWPVEGER